MQQFDLFQDWALDMALRCSGVTSGSEVDLVNGIRCKQLRLVHVVSRHASSHLFMQWLTADRKAARHHLVPFGSD